MEQTISSNVDKNFKMKHMLHNMVYITWLTAPQSGAQNLESVHIVSCLHSLLVNSQYKDAGCSYIPSCGVLGPEGRGGPEGIRADSWSLSSKLTLSLHIRLMMGEDGA